MGENYKQVLGNKELASKKKPRPKGNEKVRVLQEHEVS